MLAVYFTRDAIRDSFDSYADDDPRRLWVHNANDAQLAEISEGCVSSDVLWRTFHDVIELEVEQAMEAEGSTPPV